MPRKSPPSESQTVEETLAVFQPRTARRLDEEDARQIRHNLTGFFAVLLEWNEKDAAQPARNPKRRNAGGQNK